jgi:hypothetical protein
MVICFLIGSSFHEREKSSSIENKTQPGNLRIYLLIGQSNMAGRAPVELQDLDTLERVFLYTGQDSFPWEPAANPLNKYSTIRKELNLQKLGPGYTFAKMMAADQPGKKIGLVVNARGGTSISEWMPGTKFYNEAVSRIRATMKYGELAGIIWHQGESDVKDCNTYPAKLVQLVTALRAEFGNPELPFIAGQLSEDKPERVVFNKMITTIPDALPHSAIVMAKRLVTIDSTHFNSESQRILGERYAIEMLRLQAK